MKLYPLLFSLLALSLSGQSPSMAGGSGAIGSLPKTQRSPQDNLDQDSDMDGLSDSLEIITLKTDPFAPNPAAVELLTDSPGFFRFLVVKPLTGELLVTGAISLSFLSQLGGSEIVQFQSAQTPSTPGGSVGGVIFRPLEPEPPEPLKPQLLCVMTTVPVGSVGGVLEVQVMEANCEPFDLSDCGANDCSNHVGGTQKIVDPIVLLGG